VCDESGSLYSARPLEDSLDRLDRGGVLSATSTEPQKKASGPSSKTTAVRPLAYLPSEYKPLPNELEPRPRIEIHDGDILMTRKEIPVSLSSLEFGLGSNWLFARRRRARQPAALVANEVGLQPTPQSRLAYWVAETIGHQYQSPLSERAPIVTAALAKMSSRPSSLHI
jgi:hypothetical protein